MILKSLLEKLSWPWFPVPPAPPSDQTGIRRSDYFLEYDLPAGSLPDTGVGGKVRIRVHRVSPVYAGFGSKPRKAIVLIHGRSVPGSVSFDLQHQTSGFAALSLQEALAYAGIDTFAPDQVGFGLSSRFTLDEKANASLPGRASDGTCPSVVGCDRTRNSVVFPLDQQKMLQAPVKAHTSTKHFANNDVWAHEIRRVIDDAKSKSGQRKVALLGYSAGGPRVGKVLHQLGKSASVHISHVFMLSSLFDTLRGPGGVTVNAPIPTDEGNPFDLDNPTTFPLTLTVLPPPPATGIWDAYQQDRVPPGAPEAFAKQWQLTDSTGAQWAADSPNPPRGLVRSPTFTVTGWNKEIAAKVDIPTMVLHGKDDWPAPIDNAEHMYAALTVPKKVRVVIENASHLAHYEVSNAYEGPYRAIADAIIEWIFETTYQGWKNGRFTISALGLISRQKIWPPFVSTLTSPNKHNAERDTKSAEYV